MIGRVFAVMTVLSVGYGIGAGTLSAVTEALFAGAGRAVTVTLTLIGLMSLFGGILEVLRSAGAIRRFGRLLSPLFRILFPTAAARPGGTDLISACFAANLLGMGNAATPLAISAMREMSELSEEGVAGDDMILLVVMNTVPLTFLPTTVLGLRAAAGSHRTAAILPTVWLVSLLSTVFAILLCRFFGSVTKEKRRAAS